MLRSHSPTKSDWAEKVKALRAYLRLSQTSLARKLDIPKAAVARWEHGIEEPSPHSYINLGNLAGEPSCWYFWKHSGLYRGRLMKVLPAVRLQLRKKGRPDLQIVHAGTGTKLFSKPQSRYSAPSAECRRLRT